MKITAEELGFSYTSDWDKTGTEAENYSPVPEECIDIAFRVLVPSLRTWRDVEGAGGRMCVPERLLMTR